ncbi:MerR family transcriptional regulator [Tomitella fengzijianii]|uniref:MerR family transcriptional regulator n=1 Tax=Tomitella fengzijianii TaxID=2597660 RepID=UPI003558FF9B
MNDDTPVRDAELTVGATARLIGVSVRTLHHWDDVGLVRPSERTSAGYRVYTAPDIERLHRVLTYREVGFELQQIRGLLDDPDADAMAHLRRQRRLIDERIARLQRMATAVDTMMEAKTMGIQLTPQEQREVFGDDWLGDEYEAEAQERWGDSDAWRQSEQRAARYTKDDWKRIKDETDALEADLAAALADGAPAGGARANALAERHRAEIERFYDCSHEMQCCLAEMYVADERFRKHYDDVAPGLAQYLHDVITANAAASA